MITAKSQKNIDKNKLYKNNNQTKESSMNIRTLTALSLVTLCFTLSLNAMAPTQATQPTSNPRGPSHRICLELNDDHIQYVSFLQDNHTGQFYYLPWAWSMPQPTNIFGKTHQNSTELPIKTTLKHLYTTADVSIQNINPREITIKCALNYDTWMHSPLASLSYWFSHHKSATITLPFGEEHTIYIEDTSDTAQTNNYLAVLTIKAIHLQNH